MMGSSQNPGVIPNTLKEVYNTIDSLSSVSDITVRVSYIEVYNEVIRDLLSEKDTALELREEPGKGAILHGVEELPVQKRSEILAMFKVGNRNRMKEPTMANEVSSRSHAIFLMHITNQKTGGKQITSAKLSMIDLAGSERAAYTTNKGLRMREGANINKSLLALGNCINALSKGNKGYVPFRNSKLTRLLKDSLSGNCRTVMIANVSPGVSSYEDTLNTLKYANRAKDIKTEQKLNLREVVDEPDINNYQGLIE